MINARVTQLAECKVSNLDVAGSMPVARSRTERLFHIKLLRNKIDYISTTELAEYFPLTLVLKPQIPKVDPNREDTVTPRVSFSTTIIGAYGSLGIQDKTPLYLGIYQPVRSIEVYHPLSGIPPKDKKFYVHDAKNWEEVWSLRPVIVELQKIITPIEVVHNHNR